MNELADALSPYLRQHADNPVAWRQWGPRALAAAAERDVPLLISVGYSTCHWCHVMAHESFEDETVAAAMNEHFVPVKVDREERPDIDAVYMQTTVAITGQGGWPMTVFAFPDGTPFFAGMYFPKPHFLRLLDAVRTAWSEQRDELAHQGAAIVQATSEAGPAFADVTVACPLDGPCPPAPPVRTERLDQAARAVLAAADEVNGGFGGAPKFPTVPALRFLWDYYTRSNDASALDHIKRSAERMARGGIYDQLAGGFARYSVDESWTVPHFEKMLYDNAELLWLYSRLYGEDPLFARVADDVAAFLLEQFSTTGGGFAAAFDADTDGVEGRTYVWTVAELEAVLGVDDAAFAAEAFGIDPTNPNFEHHANVLLLPRAPVDDARFAAVRRRLLDARDRRAQPGRDDKVVAAWNGLTIASLAEYAARTGSRDSLLAAERAARYLSRVHIGGPSASSSEGRLARASLDGEVSPAPGVLEDYAAVALGFLRLGGDWTGQAIGLLAQVRERFADGLGGFHDTAEDAETLVTRPGDVHDGPTASGWALAATALLEAHLATGDETYKDDAWRAIARAEPAMDANPRFTAGLLAAAETLVRVQRLSTGDRSDWTIGPAIGHVADQPAQTVSGSYPQAGNRPCLTCVFAATVVVKGNSRFGSRPAVDRQRGRAHHDVPRTLRAGGEVGSAEATAAIARGRPRAAPAVSRGRRWAGRIATCPPINAYSDRRHHHFAIGDERGSLGPWGHGAMGPWGHGAMRPGPCGHAAMRPCGHGRHNAGDRGSDALANAPSPAWSRRRGHGP